MKKFFLVFLVVSAFFCTLFDLSESWSRRRRRYCYRQNCAYYWSSYGSCSRTCGGGQRSQRLIVTRYPTCGGTACPSQRYRTVSCNTHCCRVNCAWSWNSWSSCQGCGMSQQTRTRRITRNPSCGGLSCPIIWSETRNCNTGVCCPVNCAVSSWSSWGSCNAACGQTGNRARTRRITTQPSCKGSPCPTLTDTKSCNGPCCPGDC